MISLTQECLELLYFLIKMDQYLEKLTAKHPDSINISADVLVNLSKANGDIFNMLFLTLPQLMRDQK